MSLEEPYKKEKSNLLNMCLKIQSRLRLHVKSIIVLITIPSTAVRFFNSSVPEMNCRQKLRFQYAPSYIVPTFYLMK
jgi:hypothetical protein